jgi:hypothetical protein
VIHESLGSADIQIVILGNGMVGYTHPNKIYGALFVGKPVLYIGPQKSHITEILSGLPGNLICNHGEVEILSSKLLEFADLDLISRDQIGKCNSKYVENYLNPDFLKDKIYNALKVVSV